MSRYLTIYEVSQKQKFIFSSNRLKENIRNSDVIAHLTSADFISQCMGDSSLFSEKTNMVYAGGGHTILEFSSAENAAEVTSRVTSKILSEYPEVEFFAKTMVYDEQKLPGENVKDLTALLERKKSLRKASFHQGTFGIEKVDENTKRPSSPDYEVPARNDSMPEGFVPVYRFEDLGISKGESGFIAVVHIDGNAMGKRVEELSSSPALHDWDSYKKTMREFSESIARDFMSAFTAVSETVAACVNSGKLNELHLDEKNGQKRMPLRRIISEGDDICFVSEGRIGIACAALFLKKLASLMNPVDKKPYAACAGVAIVHAKYPFYRAYELAEALCSNAKRFGATLGSDGFGSDISSIDWHIEYGEMKDSLEDVRSQYLTDDGMELVLRPYIVCAPEDVLEKEPVRQYENYARMMRFVRDNPDAYGSGTLKELRSVMKKGAAPTEYFMRYHKLKGIERDIYQGNYLSVDFSNIAVGSGESLEGKIFAETADGKTRSLLFDAVESMDTYLSLTEGDK